MTSLLSKLFGTNTPRVRTSTRRTRLGVESLDGRIMPTTFVEFRLLLAPTPVAPKAATPLDTAASVGGQMAVSIFGKDADHGHGWVKAAARR